METSDFSKLSKKERKKLKRELEKQDFAKEQKRKTMMKWGIGIAVLVLFIAGIWWAAAESTKPLPGTTVKDLGRKHVTDIYGVKYNSNPPTSGSHFPVWAKKGAYDRVLSDGHLIHSLEHGYVVISYDCDKPITSYEFPITSVYAHEEGEDVKESTDSAAPLMHMKAGVKGDMSFFTPGNPPPQEVKLPKIFSTKACKDLVKQLSEFTKEAERIIIVPRPNMNTPIALTAWTRIEKLNRVDAEKIKTFIQAFHNKGPEVTTE